VADGPWIPPPIREYGLLGDTRTAALTPSAGSIDWMCWPRFHSEPIFGRLHSKVWAWIALDRAARTAKALRMTRSRTVAWECERELIADYIWSHGFNTDLGSYVRAYGSSEMDSALLLLPLTGFDDHPLRQGGTVDAIWKGLGLADRSSIGIRPARTVCLAKKVPSCRALSGCLRHC
jgi:GH15 family glucan-1,4-alpha-glucosidase